MDLAAFKLMRVSYRLFSITLVAINGAWSFLVFRIIMAGLFRRVWRARMRTKQKGLADEIVEDLRFEKEAFQQLCEEEALQQRRWSARMERGATFATRVISTRRLRILASFVALVVVVGYIVSRADPHSRSVESQHVNTEASDQLIDIGGVTEISDKSINTGGEKGAYHTALCPPLPAALASAYFQGYKCTPSKGTLENIARVLSYPTSIGFVQLDVYANEAIKRGEEFKKLTLIRGDIACEGLWMVTKDPEIVNYGHIQAFAKHIRFILPGRESGSAPTFAFLQENDLDGLGRVPESNKQYVADATAVLNETASGTSGKVGFFVQVADPENANIKLMVEKELRVIPVVSKEILDKKLSGQSIYQLQTFNLKSGGDSAKAIEATAACTPVAIITGAPEVFGNDRDRADDQMDLIQTVSKILAEKLLPKGNPIVADVVRFPKKPSDPEIARMVQQAENARRISEERLQ
jgi:hypothetical protein